MPMCGTCGTGIWKRGSRRNSSGSFARAASMRLLAERERLSSGGAIAPFVSTKGWQRMRNDGNGPQAFAITPQRPLRSCRWRVTEAGIEQADAHFRSEEHTSELQSLMRISYAVFCLQKKNNYY